MVNRLIKKEFVARLAERAGTDKATAERWLDAVVEEMVESFRGGYALTLRGLGSFYLERKRDGTAFKFSPGQRLRAILGWSSTYRGP